jgi:hypothetical protein
MEQRTFLVKDLKRMISESASEFKPVIGSNVTSDNKKNSEKAYKDAEEQVKKLDGGLKDPKKGKLADKVDANRTTLDYNPRTEPDKNYKERVKAQAKGYTSTMEEKNKIEKAAEFDEDGKIFNQLTKSGEKIKKEKEDLAHAGLVSHNLPKQERNTMYENTLKPKRLVFKHTKFINESYMLSRIPEEYKKDGQIIHMKDMAGNEYIVECQASSTGYIETNIKGYSNKELMTEQMKRISQLMNYKVGDNLNESVKSFRADKNNDFENMFTITRGTK